MIEDPGCHTATKVDQYKVATDYAVHWIVQTSAAHGFKERYYIPLLFATLIFPDCPVFEVTATFTDHPLLFSSHPGSPPSSQTQLVEASPHHRRCGQKPSCKDLVRRSEFLATRTIPVPRTVLSALDKAIRLRRNVASLIRAFGSPDAASDATHSSFVDSLEEARELLRAIPRQGAGVSAGPVTGRKGACLYRGNIYERLRVYETIEFEDIDGKDGGREAVVVDVHPPRDHVPPATDTDDALTSTNVPTTLDEFVDVFFGHINDATMKFSISHLVMVMFFAEFVTDWPQHTEQQRAKNLGGFMLGTSRAFESVRALETRAELFLTDFTRQNPGCDGTWVVDARKIVRVCAVYRGKIRRFRKELVKEEAWTEERVTKMMRWMAENILRYVALYFKSLRIWQDEKIAELPPHIRVILNWDRETGP